MPMLTAAMMVMRSMMSVVVVMPWDYRYVLDESLSLWDKKKSTWNVGGCRRHRHGLFRDVISVISVPLVFLIFLMEKLCIFDVIWICSVLNQQRQALIIQTILVSLFKINESLKCFLSIYMQTMQSKNPKS